MVAAAVLSAYAIWESTERGDAARGAIGNRDRHAAEGAAYDAQLNALISFDLRLTAEYAATLFARESAIGLLDWDRVAGFDTEQRILGGYFTMGVPSAPDILGDDTSIVVYDAPFVSGRQQLFDRRFATAYDAALERQATDLRSSQVRLLVAAALLTAGLAAATVADISSGRGRPAAFLIALSLAAVAVVLIVSQVGPARFLAVVGIGLGFAAAASAGRRAWRRLRRRRAGPAEAGGRHGVAWWAKVCGAATAVLLMGVAVLLASTANRQNDAVSRANRAQAAADAEQVSSTQRALDDVAAAITLERLRVQASVSADESELARLHDLASRLQVLLDQRVRVVEDEENSRGAHALGVIGEVPVNGRGVAVYEHLVRSTHDAEVHAFDANVKRSEARHLDGRAAALTFALVLMGVGGFLMSLASDEDHHPSTGWQLLGTGVAGVVAGLTVASMAVFGAPPVGHGSSAEDIEAAARDYAAGVIALQIGACADAAERLGSVTESFAELGIAHLAHALAIECGDRPVGVYRSMPADLDGYVAGAERAVATDPTNPEFQHHLGWGYLLRGLVQGAPSDLRASEALTRANLRLSPNEPIFLFNLAYTEIALGRHGQGTATFERAIACTLHETVGGAVAEPCSGARRADPRFEQAVALNVLGDLDVLEAHTGLDLAGFRSRLMVAVVGAPPTDTGAELAVDAFTVFPLELQLTTTALPDDGWSVVWFHRPEGAENWSLLIEASFATLLPATANIGLPIDAGLVLQSGEYRADLYHLGHYRNRVTSTRPPNVELQRWSWPDLGLDVALPATWEGDPETFGFERLVIDPEDPRRGMLALRLEGWPPEHDLVAALEYLADFYFGTGDMEDTWVDATEPYFLGLANHRQRYHVGSDLWASVAFSPTCASAEGPGVLLAVFLMGVDADEYQAAVDSLRLKDGVTSLLSVPTC